MNSQELLSSIVAYRTYCKYVPPLNRRETLEESINRTMTMFLERFPELSRDIIKAFTYVHQLQVFPSMRNLQFAGQAVQKNPLRSFNCSFTSITNPDVFSEIVFLLLSGTGVGFSVQNHHVYQLPIIKKPMQTGTFLIQDSIAGWSSAVNALFFAYMYNRVKPIFDYSAISPLGTILSTVGSKAPGPEPLRKALIECERRLEQSVGRKLRAIEVHDLICILSDAVLSGGIRRSACISFFSKDNDEMLKCKTGNWWEHSPHRMRANNSVILPRDITTKKDFDNVFEMTKLSGSGEPGFSWTDDIEYGANPCIPANAKLLSPNGIKELKDISIGDKIWSGKRWTTVTNKWSTGIQQVYKYHTNSNIFIGTKNHKIVYNKQKVEVGLAKGIDVALGPCPSQIKIDPQDVMDGLVLGDGTVHKASGNLIGLLIGEKDGDYHKSEIASLIKKHRPGITECFHTIKTTITVSELPKTYNRVIPDRFYYGDVSKRVGFLRGLFSANGCVTADRVQYKGSSKILVEQVQELLSSLGLRSSLVINKPATITHRNGVYTSKESYNLILYNSSKQFMELIGFLQNYKNEKVVRSTEAAYVFSEINKVETLCEMEVFDITVDDDEHVFWNSGCLVSNCHEISLQNQQLCNLTSINQTRIKNEKTLLNCIYAATLIGTLQASFTDFPYLNPKWKETCDEEALIGVSFTGICDSNLVDRDLLQKASKHVLEVNERYAKRIGINLAARTTCIKPEGSLSAVSGSSSGIHARHAQHYLRRVQMNEHDALVNYLKDRIPDLVEKSVNAPDTLVVTIPQCSPEGSVLRSQETALDLFKRILFYQRNWIALGHRKGANKNNVSATISVKDHEWDELREEMWKHRDLYTGISLLPYSDSIYKQAPFEECTEETYKKLNEYISDKKINLKEVLEDTDNTKRIETIACSGNSCEII